MPSRDRRARPHFTGAMDKLFGENQSFSATLEMQMASTADGTITMPGKITFDSGKSRFEMDMTQAKGGQMSPDAGAQMKAMGMDRMVMIGRAGQKSRLHDLSGNAILRRKCAGRSGNNRGSK